MIKLQRVMDFCIRHQTTLGYSTVSLLTVASEQIFLTVVFKCPCNSGNMLYGSVFLLVPAFILFLLGYLVNASVWSLLTGSCPPEKSCSCNLCSHYCCELGKVTAKALVAPLTWIAVALLSASFYECAASGSSVIQDLICKDKGEECRKLLVKIPCGQELRKNISGEFLSLQAQSRLIGWLLIACITTLTLIFTCISHCRSQVRYPQFKFWNIYLEKEEELFEDKAKAHAAKLAESNLDWFFKTTDKAPIQNPSNEAWQKISFLHTFSPQEPYYSMIHKYVTTNRGNSDVAGAGNKQLSNP